MGAVTFSLDPALLDCLRGALQLDVFVETGTFEGATAELAAASFPEVHTVELSDEYYRKAKERLSSYTSVHVYRGDSVAVLKQLQPRLASRGVLYWLDAHWCDASDTAGAESQCPLLEELAAIGEINANSVILIDDARLFLCPPPGTHRPEQWPSLDALVRRLLGLGLAHELVVLNDVICLYPRKVEATLRQLALRHAYDWLAAADKARGYDEMLKQMIDKEELIMRLHTEAGRLQTVLAETTKLLHRCDGTYRDLDEEYRQTLESPKKLASLCARAVRSSLRRSLFRSKPA
jgi:hypothetical protein